MRKSDEPRMLAGQVRAGGSGRLARVIVEAEGEQSAISRSEEFEIEVDGAVVVVVKPAADTALLPEREERGAFGELLGDPMARLALSKAPGDHVETELRGNVIAEGDLIAVYGRVEHVSSAGDGYRGAPEASPRAIEAQVVVIGGEGREPIDRWLEEREKELGAAASAAAKASEPARKKARKPRAKEKDDAGRELPSLTPVWIFAALALATSSGAFGAGAFAIRPSESTSQWWSAALALSTVTFLIWRRRRWFPEFREVGEGKGGKGVRWEYGLLVFSYLILAGVLGLLAPLHPMGFLVALALLGLVFSVVPFRGDLRSARIARDLLRAEPLPADLPDAAFGAVEGEFDGSIDLKRAHRVQSESYRETRTDASGGSYQATTTKTKVTWSENWKKREGSIATEAGEIHLELDGALWAGLSELRPGKAPYDAATMKAFDQMEDGLTKKWILMEARSMGPPPHLLALARSGDSILAAGRVRRSPGPEFRATGPGSMILFTSAPGTSARAILRRELGVHRLGLFCLVGTQLFAVLLALFATI